MRRFSLTRARPRQSRSGRIPLCRAQMAGYLFVFAGFVAARRGAHSSGRRGSQAQEAARRPATLKSLRHNATQEDHHRRHIERARGACGWPFLPRVGKEAFPLHSSTHAELAAVDEPCGRRMRLINFFAAPILIRHASAALLQSDGGGCHRTRLLRWLGS